jgi:gliding motility-associated-like protein
MKKNLLAALVLLSTAGFSYAQPACPTVQMSGNDVSCYGESDGSVTATIISSPLSSYTYTWSDSSQASGPSASLTNLPAGTYTVNVTDGVSGCSVIGAFVVGSPDPIVITGIATDVDCHNDNTGSVDIDVTGGSGTYTYQWFNNSVLVQSTQDLTNASAGTYVVNVLAPNAACSSSSTFIIDEPIESLQMSGVVTNVSCFATPTGAVDVSVWGGTPPYAYSWDSGATTEDISGVGSGNYTLTVTDSRMCTISTPYFVDQPTQLSGTMSATDVACFGNETGIVGVVANGGTAPYSYSWQNSTTLFAQDVATLTNVGAESYQVTITDANGCTWVGTQDVLEPTQLVGSVVSTNVTCNGLSDGSIDLTVSGGVGPYTYQWSNSVPVPVSSTEDLDSIPAETYTVLVTDANFCTITLTREVTQPPLPLAAATQVVDVLCFGENTGEIDLSINGGTPPYTYTWNTGQTTEDIAALLAGTYNFNVEDANNCLVSGSAVVSQPSFPLSVTNLIQDVACFGESNGSIDLTVSGGTAPYEYSWINSTFQLSATSEDLSNFPADSYAYVVTDDNGCTFSDTLTISEPPLLESSIVGTDILCFGGNNGAIDLTVTGGVPAYAYLWNTGAVTEDLTGLVAGSYQVTVTDQNGCVVEDSITLEQPADSLSFTLEVEDVLCKDGSDGEIELDVAGGTLPYDFSWSNGDTFSQIENLTAGWYEFLVTDGNGCTTSDSVFVNEPDAVTLNEVITDVTCNAFSDGIIDISPVGGTLPYNFTWYNSQFALSAQTEDLVNYPADIYQLEIVDSNGCFYEMFLEITEPDVIDIQFTSNVVSCYNGSDGNIFVDITGGTQPYITQWSNGSTNEDQINIPAGLYELDVTDQQGCTDSIEVFIDEPDPITIEFEAIEVSCIDDNDGIAFAYPAGGNGGYFYNWSNGETNSTNTDLSNETYTLEVSDILGCLGTGSVFIPKDSIGCVFPVNTFTPNGDDYNDTWVIDNMELYPNANVKIFNKWGNLIHEQNGLYVPWDGKENGKDLPAEVYYWIINLNEPDREILTGNIIIVR